MTYNKLLADAQKQTRMGELEERFKENTTPDLIMNDETEIGILKKTQEEIERAQQQLEQEIMGVLDDDVKFLQDDAKVGFGKSGHRIASEEPRILGASKPEEGYNIEAEIQKALAERQRLRGLIKNEKDPAKQKNLKELSANNEERYKVLDKLRKEIKDDEVVVVQKKQEPSQVVDNKKQSFNATRVSSTEMEIEQKIAKRNEILNLLEREVNLDKQVELKKLLTENEKQYNDLVFAAKVQKINDDLQLRNDILAKGQGKILETDFQYKQAKEQQQMVDACAKDLLEVMHALVEDETKNVSNKDIKELQATHVMLTDFMQKNSLSDLAIEKHLRNCADSLYEIIEQKKMIETLGRQANLIQEKIVNDMRQKNICPVSNESLQTVMNRIEQFIEKAKYMRYSISQTTIKDRLSKGITELTKVHETLLDWQKKEQFQHQTQQRFM